MVVFYERGRRGYSIDRKLLIDTNFCLSFQRVDRQAAPAATTITKAAVI